MIKPGAGFMQHIIHALGSSFMTLFCQGYDNILLLSVWVGQIGTTIKHSSQTKNQSALVANEQGF